MNEKKCENCEYKDIRGIPCLACKYNPKLLKLNDLVDNWKPLKNEPAGDDVPREIRKYIEKRIESHVTEGYHSKHDKDIKELRSKVNALESNEAIEELARWEVLLKPIEVQLSKLELPHVHDIDVDGTGDIRTTGLPETPVLIVTGNTPPHDVIREVLEYARGVNVRVDGLKEQVQTLEARVADQHAQVFKEGKSVIKELKEKIDENNDHWDDHWKEHDERLSKLETRDDLHEKFKRAIRKMINNHENRLSKLESELRPRTTPICYICGVKIPSEHLMCQNCIEQGDICVYCKHDPDTCYYHVKSAQQAKDSCWHDKYDRFEPRGEGGTPSQCGNCKHEDKDKLVGHCYNCKYNPDILCGDTDKWGPVDAVERGLNPAEEPPAPKCRVCGQPFKLGDWTEYNGETGKSTCWHKDSPAPNAPLPHGGNEGVTHTPASADSSPVATPHARGQVEERDGKAGEPVDATIRDCINCKWKGMFGHCSACIRGKALIPEGMKDDRKDNWELIEPTVERGLNPAEEPPAPNAPVRSLASTPVKVKPSALEKGDGKAADLKGVFPKEHSWTEPPADLNFGCESLEDGDCVVVEKLRRELTNSKSDHRYDHGVSIKLRDKIEELESQLDKKLVKCCEDHEIKMKELESEIDTWKTNYNVASKERDALREQKETLLDESIKSGELVVELKKERDDLQKVLDRSDTYCDICEDRKKSKALGDIIAIHEKCSVDHDFGYETNKILQEKGFLPAEVKKDE